MRVLLVDADQAFVEVVQSFLWDRGHEAEIAGSGWECAAVWREFRPDVLVLDADLTRADGDGFLARMDRDMPLAAVSVILTSDGEIPEELVAYAGLPAACLSKPYRLGALLHHINAVRVQSYPSVPASESA
jgi:DNA-binding response OmpR family regulator